MILNSKVKTLLCQATIFLYGVGLNIAYPREMVYTDTMKLGELLIKNISMGVGLKLPLLSLFVTLTILIINKLNIEDERLMLIVKFMMYIECLFISMSIIALV